MEVLDETGRWNRGNQLRWSWIKKYVEINRGKNRKLWHLGRTLGSVGSNNSSSNSTVIDSFYNIKIY